MHTRSIQTLQILIVKAKNWRLISPYFGSKLAPLSLLLLQIMNSESSIRFRTSDIQAQATRHGVHLDACIYHHHHHVFHYVIEARTKSMSLKPMMSLPSSSCGLEKEKNSEYAPTLGSIRSSFSADKLDYLSRLTLSQRSTSQSASTSCLICNDWGEPAVSCR